MAVVMMVAVGSYAQQKTIAQSTKQTTEKMSPEQRNDIRLKQMTLQLDLNAAQQKEFAKIISEQSAKRQTAMADRKAGKNDGENLTAAQKFDRKSKRLDDQIVMKKRIQGILTPEQFAKWEKMKMQKHQNFKHGKKGEHKKVGEQKGK